MAKRSPILGYNHNVLYRGLVFHVQTEDSGQLSPHLFTHLFHGGVIISTRKLVYDAGSAEDAIKGLMQSQHKIVLKDLKRGTFDDKIDAYLVGTEGLLPRTTPVTSESAPPPADLVRPSAPELTPPPPDDPPRLSAPEITIHRPGTEELDALDPIEPIELISDEPSAPLLIFENTPPPALPRAATPPPIPRAATPLPMPARTVTAERKSGAASMRPHVAPPPPPSPDEIDPPTDPDVDSAAIRVALNATVRTPMANLDSAPEISIKLDLEDEEPPQLEARTRSKHDTDIHVPSELEGGQLSDGVPGRIGGAPSGQRTRPGESIPPLPPPPERKTGDRNLALGASALPPARPITRPPSRQAITPPTVMSRPLPGEDRTDAVEVYAPPPASADPPPGERAERPGQYAQHKKPSTGKLPVDVVRGERERTGSIPIPAGLSRPGRAAVMPAVTSPGSGRTHPPSSPQPISSRSATPPSGPTSQQVRSPSQQYPVVNPQPVRSPSQQYPVVNPQQARSPSQQYPVVNPQQARSPSQQYPVVNPQPVRSPSQQYPVVNPQQARSPSQQQAAISRANTPSSQPPVGRTPTPSRVSPPGIGPTQNRSTSGQSGGVVMTRPAVIVGAPAKPAAPPRVRKAREEEGRGFGQGLISEKSLDEVILAYLSEDADDK